MHNIPRGLGPLAILFALTTLLMGLPATALAQGEDTEDIDAEIEAALGGGAEAADPEVEEEALPEIGEDQLAVFVLQRGFYCSGDVGFFMTFGGVRGYSNLQPYVALKVGFDITDFLSTQLSVSAGYSSGNALSQNEAQVPPAQGVIDYSLLNMGAEVVFLIRPTARFAIEPKVGGGLTRIHPQPTDPGDPRGIIGEFGPHVMGGVDLKYLTLLTDFSAGLSLTGYFIIGPNIPAAAAALTTRYTF